MSSANKKNDLLSQPIAPTLKRMTVPMVMGMIALMSFNLIDTFFIGLIGTDELAAISFTFPITFTVISLTIGLSIGTSAVIAKSLGGGNQEIAKTQGISAILLSIILVISLALIGYATIEPLFSLLGSEANTMPFIKQYMQIWYLGAVFLVLPMIGNAILRASGDTKTPGSIMALGGLINAILDPILIFGFGPIEAMGIEGAAIASLISWIITSSTILYLLAVKRGLISFKVKSWSDIKISSLSIVKIGLPAAGANMLTPIAMAILTAIIAQYGHEAVAAFGVGQRLESIACIVILALSMTLPPFISQNYGAEQVDRVVQAYEISIKFVLVWQFGIYLLLAVLAPYIAILFSSETEVQSLIKLFIWTLPLSYGCQGIIILTNSAFNALHKPLTALHLSIARLFIFYVPFAYIGGEIYGVTGLFIGCVIANFCMATASFYRFRKQVQQCGAAS
ncbi:multidrug transporter MatE [Catenovulum maritimum]|uniref:Multidrug transporter MatE n=2 Tax=Catenovulum maritimum TaxID=1513271 RepID=A0A0J8GQB5_9ALTE|nr:multidrug transporter MatE [Catenovulum maritimum]